MSPVNTPDTRDSLPPFLAKLRVLSQNSDPNVAGWNAAGDVYIVRHQQRFLALLKSYFKGTLLTFIRQLHFYGFRKVDVNLQTGEVRSATKSKKFKDFESEVVTWGFRHEQKLFIRDDPSLAKEIKRNAKVDPDTQTLASFYQVEALKGQVTFLQQVIQDMRIEINDIKQNPQQSLSDHTEIRKRPRTSFSQLCTKVEENSNSSFEPLKPKLKQPIPNLDLCSLPSFDAQIGDEEFEKFSEFFSDLDLDSDSDSEAGSNSTPNRKIALEVLPTLNETKDNEMSLDSIDLEEAIGMVSEATRVNPGDVEKILTFLSTLSLGRVAKRSDVAKEHAFPTFESLGDQMSARIQKVGAS